MQQPIDSLESRARMARATRIQSVRMAQDVQRDFVQRANLTAEYYLAEGQAGLHGATSSSEVISWLRRGAPIDGVQQITSYSDTAEHWETPLLTALVDGHIDAAQTLLASGADVDALSMTVERTTGRELTFSALHMMVSRRSAQGINFLLTAGANVNLASSDGTTPIWFAARNDDARLVQDLIRAGADIDVVDLLGRRPVDGAGPATRDLLATSAPRKVWDASTPASFEIFPEVRGDVDFNLAAFSDLPAGWQRPQDLTEVFLVAGSLEFQMRQRINAFNPFASGVWERLPIWCKHDPLASLLAFGGHTVDETSSALADSANAHDLTQWMERGEPWGRLTMVQLAWQYVDEVFPLIAGVSPNYWEMQSRLDGTVLGKFGTELVLAGLRSKLDPRGLLSDVERYFVAGRTFQSAVPANRGARFSPNPRAYIDSIWQLVFRLIELRSPEYYLSRYPQRVREVRAIFVEVENLVIQSAQSPHPHGWANWWPGWEFITQVKDSQENRM